MLYLIFIFFLLSIAFVYSGLCSQKVWITTIGIGLILICLLFATFYEEKPEIKVNKYSSEFKISEEKIVLKKIN